MKKLQRLFGVLLVTVLVALTFAGCVEPISDNGEYITIKVGDGGVKTDKEYFGELLDELNASGELVVSFNEDTGYGRWLKGIGTLQPDPASEYIALYVTSDDMNHVDPLSKKEVDGVTYYYTIKGVDSLPVIEGATYLLMILSF